MHVVAKRARFVLGGLLIGMPAMVEPARAQAVPCSRWEVSANLPPAGSGPLVRCIQVIFHPEAASSIDAETYLYYVKPFEASQRSVHKWVPYNEAQPLAAFSRLMRTPPRPSR